MDITPKQRKIVKEKIKGKTNKQIGAIVYPNAKPESARVQVSGQLNKPNVAQYYEQGKLIALKEAGVTWKWIIDGIKEAGDAYKQNNFTGEVTPDYSIRLSARKQAISLLEAKHTPEDAKENLLNIPADANVIDLVRIFKQ